MKKKPLEVNARRRLPLPPAPPHTKLRLKIIEVVEACKKYV